MRMMQSGAKYAKPDADTSIFHAMFQSRGPIRITLRSTKPYALDHGQYCGLNMYSKQVTMMAVVESY